jgi:hypothetical protein
MDEGMIQVSVQSGVHLYVAASTFKRRGALDARATMD